MTILSVVKEREVDYKEIHKQPQRNVEIKQAKNKQYVDEKRRAKDSNIQSSDEVLVKQAKTNKFSPQFASSSSS